MQEIKPQRVSYLHKPEPPASFSSSQTTLWLGGLETWEDETYMYSLFQQLLPAFCSITNITIVRDPTTDMSLGYGFVDFATHQAAETALQICRKSVRPGHTRPFRISWAASNTFSHRKSTSSTAFSLSPTPPPSAKSYQSPPFQSSSAASYGPPMTFASEENLTLYVTPLEKQVTKFTLAEEIKKFGYTSVISIKIAHNENGISRGFGFIRFGNREECNDALERLKTLRLGENQQSLHVTLARCNSYDPEYTLTNEILFGHPSQQQQQQPPMPCRRLPAQSLYPKRRRRHHYGPASQMINGPPVPLNEVNGPGNPMMMHDAMFRGGPYPPPNLNSMPLGSQTPSSPFMISPMMGVPAPPGASSSSFPMASGPNQPTSYNAPPSSIPQSYSRSIPSNLAKAYAGPPPGSQQKYTVVSSVTSQRCESPPEYSYPTESPALNDPSQSSSAIQPGATLVSSEPLRNGLRSNDPHRSGSQYASSSLASFPGNSSKTTSADNDQDLPNVLRGSQGNLGEARQAQFKSSNYGGSMTTITASEPQLLSSPRELNFLMMPVTASSTIDSYAIPAASTAASDYSLSSTQNSLPYQEVSSGFLQSELPVANASPVYHNSHTSGKDMREKYVHTTT